MLRQTAISFLVCAPLVALTACEDYPGYPHNEPAVRRRDVSKSGSGYYGGVTGQDQSKATPGGPLSTSPASSRTGPVSDVTPSPTRTSGTTETGTYGNNSAGGSSAGMSPNNGTAPTQDGGSH